MAKVCPHVYVGSAMQAKVEKQNQELGGQHGTVAVVIASHIDCSMVPAKKVRPRRPLCSSAGRKKPYRCGPGVERDGTSIGGVG